MAETYTILSVVSFLLAGVSGMAAVVFWLQFDIPKILKDRSGCAGKCAAKRRREGEGQTSDETEQLGKTAGKRTGKVLRGLLLLSAAVCLIFAMCFAVPARAAAQGCRIELVPSQPAADNGTADVYGYYNADSEVSVQIRVRTDAGEPGIQKIECRITDGTEEAGTLPGLQILYEDLYEEPDEPEEPEEADEPEEPDEAQESEKEEGSDDPEDRSEETKDPEDEPEETDEPDPHQALEFWEGSVQIDTALWHTGEVRVYVRAIDFGGTVREDSVQLDIDAAPPFLSLSYDNNDSSGVDADGNLLFNGAQKTGKAETGAVRTATLVITERSDHFSGEKASAGIRITAADADGVSPDAASGVAVSAWKTQKGDTPDQDTHTATIAFFGDALYTLEISYTDEAGNENRGVDTGSAAAPWRFVVDATAPVIEVRYDRNDPFTTACYGSVRTATIRIKERNFDPERVDIAVSNPDGSTPAVSEWKRSTDGSGGDPVYTAALVFSEDGDYTLSASASDRAGNRTEEILFADGTSDGSAFTIDRTSPRVTVCYDNDRVYAEHYFNEPRVATVAITERNFDQDRVTLLWTAETEGEDDVITSVSWQHEGDVHTATVAFSADGEYTFDVSLVDLAGNESGEADFGDSAAPRSFTIDSSPPEVIVTGVADGQSCRGAVSPGIRLYDRNFSDCEISLTRTRLDEIGVDVTDRFFPERELSGQGGMLVCRALEQVRDNDGIYTLRVWAADLAGNEREISVTFSVNRFGSVYVYGDYLISLIGDSSTYVQAVEEDLVITEYNPDRLVAGSLFLDITRDGRPLSDVDCAFSSVPGTFVSTGSRGWYEYRYTIDRSNFAQDGVYKLSLSSGDEAGNTSDCAQATGQDVLFWVDSAAPEITGMPRTDDGGILAKGENFDYTVYDTVGLKALEMYLNGEILGEPVTDFGEDLNHFAGSISIEGTASEQEVRLVATDLAGNTADIRCAVPVGVQTITERIDSPKEALEQMAEGGILIPCIEGAAAAAAILLILLLVRRKTMPKKK